MAKVNLVLEQGTDYSTEIDINDDNGNPLDLGGYSAYAQFKKFFTTNTVAGHFDVELETGSIILSMQSVNSKSVPDGRYVYDVLLVDPNGKRSRPIEGILTVTPAVSSNT